MGSSEKQWRAVWSSGENLGAVGSNREQWGGWEQWEPLGSSGGQWEAVGTCMKLWGATGIDLPRISLKNRKYQHLQAGSLTLT